MKLDYFTDFFSKKIENEKYSHILFLLMLAKCDGEITSEENLLIKSFGLKMGLTANEIIQIEQNPQKYKVTVPSDEFERNMYILNFIKIITSDGILDPKEIKLLLKFCKIYHVDTSWALDILLGIQEIEKKGFDARDAYWIYKQKLGKPKLTNNQVNYFEKIIEVSTTTFSHHLQLTDPKQYFEGIIFCAIYFLHGEEKTTIKAFYLYLIEKKLSYNITLPADEIIDLVENRNMYYINLHSTLEFIQEPLPQTFYNIFVTQPMSSDIKITPENPDDLITFSLKFKLMAKLIGSELYKMEVKSANNK